MAGIKWAKKEDSLMKKHYSNINNDDLVYFFPNRSRNAIVLRAQKLKLKKKLSTYKRSGKIKNLLKETLEAYYWIGFILADGSINHQTKRLKILLSNKDIQSIYQLANFLDIENQHNNVISIQDKEYIPKLIKKFDFKQNKTKNPPKKSFKLDSKLMSLYCGFIDGDGCIKKQYKRTDTILTIKLHKTWLKFLRQIEINLYKYFKIKQYNNIIRTKVNNAGYASLHISDSRLLKKLKLFVIKNKLPVMNRKWAVINETHINKYEIACNRRKQVKSLFKRKYSYNEISKILNLKYSCVYAIINRTSNKGGTYV